MLTNRRDDLPTVPTPARRWAFAAGLAALVLVGAGATALTKPWTKFDHDATLRAAITERLGADSLAAALQDDALQADQNAVYAFYAARGNAPAWTRPEARDAARDLLAHSDRDAIPTAEALGLAEASHPASGARTAGGTSDSLDAIDDVRLTLAVLRFGRLLRTPRADARELYGARAWEPADHPPARLDGRALARALARTGDPNQALAAFADAQRPDHDGYRRLQAALAREMDLAAAPDLVIPADVAPADTGAAVRRLRARLGVERLGVAPDGPYDQALEQAVRAYQQQQDLPATGRADAPTRQALNRRQADAIPALALNLERWRWLPDSLGDLHAFVNIPEFEMTVRERRGARWAEVFRSVVVVGKPSWATPVFSDTMEQVVFNPTWTMPRSIQIESYGRPRPDRAVRQPGPGNALGRVKFLFPNRHAVYVHDTPSKWGFSQERRALSHGCVRSGDPEGLAEAILTRTNGWSASEVADVYNGPWRLQNVTLDRPVPVHIAYFTASADATGRVTTYDDVYDRDARLAEALGG